MIPHSARRGAGLLLALALLSLSSCAGKLGWGVLLWTSPDGRLPAGSLVPVYIRSNIEKLYVVGLPESREKLELPLWSLELFRSKRAARERIAELGPHLTDYLLATRDGLPVREEPSNSAQRVYRLREGQSVKILAEVEGAAVSTGGEALEGSWYQVLTEDGTRGFVFSNTMRRYDELVERPGAAAAVLASTPGRIDHLFARTWRPEYFQDMLDEGRLDLDLFNQRYGLFADAVRRQIRVELPAASKVFNYTSIAEEGGTFLFEGTELRIRFDGESRLLADWSGQEAREAEPASPGPVPAPAGASGGPAEEGGPDPSRFGSGSRAEFAAIQAELRDAIRAEETRRQKLLDALLDGGADWLLVPPAAGYAEAEASEPLVPGAEAAPPPLPAGPSRLVLSRGKRFSWTGIAALPPSYLPSDLGAVQEGTASGVADVRLALAPELAALWEGSLSLRFDGARAWSDFLYRHAEGRLELLPVQASARREAVRPAALEPLAFLRQD